MILKFTYNKISTDARKRPSKICETNCLFFSDSLSNEIHFYNVIEPCFERLLKKKFEQTPSHPYTDYFVEITRNRIRRVDRR